MQDLTPRINELMKVLSLVRVHEECLKEHLAEHQGRKWCKLILWRRRSKNYGSALFDSFVDPRPVIINDLDD